MKLTEQQSFETLVKQGSLLYVKNSILSKLIYNTTKFYTSRSTIQLYWTSCLIQNISPAPKMHQHFLVQTITTAPAFSALIHQILFFHTKYWRKLSKGKGSTKHITNTKITNHLHFFPTSPTTMTNSEESPSHVSQHAHLPAQIGPVSVHCQR